MSTRKVKAGEAYVELTAKDKMAAGLKRAEAQLKSFAVAAEAIGQSIAAVGAGLMAGGTAILGALSGAAKVFADTGSAVQDLANRTGLATDHLSELQYAAEQTGASVGALEAGLRTMIKQGMKPGDFDAIAARLANIADPAERAAEAMKVFGKSGMQLLPMLGELQALRGQARDLGLSISPESAARADALGDAFDNLLRVGKDLAYELGDAIAEPLTRIIQASTQAAVAVSGFVANNQALIAGIAGLAVAATAAGAVMVGFGTALMGVAVASQLLVATYAALAAPFVLVGAGIAAIVAALLMGAGAWLVFAKAGQETLAVLADALRSGNLQTAFALVTEQMFSLWTQFSHGLVMVFTEAMRRVMNSFSGMRKAISDDLLESSAAGNKLASFVLGVDLAEEQKRENELTAKLNAGNRAAGRPEVASRNVLAEAKRDAARQLDAMAEPFGNWLDEIDATSRASILAAQHEVKQLREQLPSVAVTPRAMELPRLADMFASLDVASGLGAGGGAAGTFSAAGAGLLGRAAPALEREAKEQTGLLKGIKDVLSDIDDGIDELEGFAMG